MSLDTEISAWIAMDEKAGTAENVSTEGLVREFKADERLVGYRDKAFGAWEEKGWIKRGDRDGGKERIEIINPDFLLARQAKRLLAESAASMKFDKEWGGGTMDQLLWLFEGVEVEYQGEVKNMFYLPRTEEAAYDLQMVEEDWNKAHFGLWQVVGRMGETYPTAEKYKESQLPAVEAVLMGGIYGEAEGRRDWEGVLWVRGEPMVPNSEYVKINGSWIGRNLGLKLWEGESIVDRPRETVEKVGQNLVERGLLQPEDFDTRDWVTKRVMNQGSVYLQGADGMSFRMQVGRRWAGAKVEQITNSRYLISDDSDHFCLLDTQLVDYRDMKLRAYANGSTMVDVSAGDTEKALVDAFGGDRPEQVTIRFAGERREMALYAAISSVIELRHHFREKYGRDLNITQLNFADQVAVAETLKAMNNKPEYEDLSMENPDVFDGLALKHIETIDYLDNFFDELQKGLDQNKVNRLFFVRARDAIVAKSGELWQKAVETGDPDLYQKLEEGHVVMGALRSVLAGENEYKLVSEIAEESLVEPGRVGHVTFVYQSLTNERLIVTLRPKADRINLGGGDSREAEACFRVTHVGPDGARVGLRMDMGTGGEVARPSVDVDALKDTGLDHHAEATFEAGWQEERVFGEVMKSLGKRMRMSEYLEEKGQSWRS